MDSRPAVLPGRVASRPVIGWWIHDRQSMTAIMYRTASYVRQQGIAPRAARRYASRRRQFDPKIAADLRPSADGSAVRTSLVTGGG